MNVAASIRVLVVDDSALMRSLISAMLNEHPKIRVVGEAADPYEAREKIKSLSPDVVTLDVEMPKMDGLSFLEKIMRLRPTPVVMVSTLTERGADVTLRALELGAVDCVAKPSDAGSEGVLRIRDELTEKVIAASRARLQGVSIREETPTKPLPAFGVGAENVVIALGASTGGVEALKAVFSRLPADCPPIVVVQHMPPGFTASFAERLARESKINVSESGADRILKPGMAVLAAGHAHLKLARERGVWVAKTFDGDKVSGHRPSVDVLFESVAQAAGVKAVGALLTGMGKDGAIGLKTMRASGSATFAQDEATSLVYGMPRAAAEAGAIDAAVPLERIAETLLVALRRRVDARGRLS